LDYDAEKITLKDLKNLTRKQSRAIAKVRQRTSKGGDVTIEIELHDKLQALDKLCRVLGLFSDVTLQQVNNYVVRAPAVAASSEAWEEQAQEIINAEPQAQPLPAPPADPPVVVTEAERAMERERDPRQLSRFFPPNPPQNLKLGR
jgi:hypothetical protein